MKAAIYNPYLDTLGGGERYTLTFAKVLADDGWIVDLQWGGVDIKKSLEDRFGMDLSAINIINDVKRGDGYDVCFWVSDGSIPTLRARKNFLHFQVPFHDVKGNNLLNKMKMIRINKIICNSMFTKAVIDKEYGVDSIVIYPPVPVDQIKPKRKENLILSVGRFSQLKQSKRQDILVKTFKKMIDQGLKDYKLVIAGGVEVGVSDYVDGLVEMSKDYPIDIVTSPSFKELVDLYGKTRIFWSASGFEEDENKNPEKVEHFGISVVEAMAAGCVPVVSSAGGHKEIVQNGVNGFLWDNTRQLMEYTNKLISDKTLCRITKIAALEKSRDYSYSTFKSNVEKIL